MLICEPRNMRLSRVKIIGTCQQWTTFIKFELMDSIFKPDVDRFGFRTFCRRFLSKKSEGFLEAFFPVIQLHRDRVWLGPSQPLPVFKPAACNPSLILHPQSTPGLNRVGRHGSFQVEGNVVIYSALSRVCSWAETTSVEEFAPKKSDPKHTQEEAGSSSKHPFFRGEWLNFRGERKSVQHIQMFDVLENRSSRLNYENIHCQHMVLSALCIQIYKYISPCLCTHRIHICAAFI